MSIPMKYFKTHTENHIYHVVIDRPSKYNAFHQEMYEEFRDVLKATPSNARCVLLYSSNPKFFTAGIDVTLLSSNTIRDQAQLEEWVKDFQHCFNFEFHVPIVTVVSGYCFGLAIDLLTSLSSITIASQDTKFGILEITKGIVADIGTLQHLPLRTSNKQLAYELALTGRKFNVSEAKELGLVRYIEPSFEDALNRGKQLAAQIAQWDRELVTTTVKAMDHAWRDWSKVETGLEIVRKANAKRIIKL